jgi:hypothetical protein
MTGKEAIRVKSKETRVRERRNCRKRDKETRAELHEWRAGRSVPESVMYPSSTSTLIKQAKACTEDEHRQSSLTTNNLVTLPSGANTQKMGKNPRWGAAVRADIKHLHHLGLLHKHGMSHRQIKNGSSRCASLIVQEILNRERIGAVTTTLCSTRFF